MLALNVYNMYTMIKELIMKFIFNICFLLVVTVILPAQTADRIDQLMDSRALNYEQVVSFVLEAADIWNLSGAVAVPGSNEAYQFALNRNWLPKGVSPDTSARLDGVSLILMHSFGIEGGLFFSLTKNPRYAYRELEYLEVIQGRVSPQMAVSGELLIFLINRIYFILDNEDTAPAVSLNLN